MNVTEPAPTKSEATILITPRKDVSFGFCLHCRKLNSWTVQDSYLIQKMAECIDSFRDKTIFSPSDAISGYFQMKIGDKNRDKGRSRRAPANSAF